MPETREKHFWESAPHSALLQHTTEMKTTSLAHLLKDPSRSEKMIVDVPETKIIFDYSRQNMDSNVLQLLLDLAKKQNVPQKIQRMFNGEKLNETEQRSVLHVALRSQAGDKFVCDNESVVKPVHQVLDQIKTFSEQLRSGSWKGFTGKQLKSIICIGIGGSYLGPEFVFEAMKTWPPCAHAAEGRTLRFLANVDPIDVARALDNLDLEETLCIIISKTFTTAETMLNARTIKEKFIEKFKNQSCIAKHMIAVSTNTAEVEKFGIDPKNIFQFWDWVGGRFSVCSAVGVLPLSLQYGFTHVRDFLDGCRNMDLHFKNASLDKNLPVLAALTSFWNTNYLQISNVAVLPYCQALLRFPAHIQQLTMESNGKAVNMAGITYPSSFQTGEIFFGEPGTNGQHSFYQLLHQGRVVQSEFIGFVKSQCDIHNKGDVISNHDELMANFFAQPDALALGKSADELRREKCPDKLIPHRTFPGNRPSTILLLPECSPYHAGQLLALYEHRTAVEGFLWGLNSFDQWGVELGKQLAKQVREELIQQRKNLNGNIPSNFISSTRVLLKKYLQ